MGTIELDREALRRELVRMTDWHTDELFGCVVGLGGVFFVNRLSRLVVDPERFRDDAREPMSACGMGAVYTRTSDGAPLRQGLTVAKRETLLSRYYDPCALAFERLVCRMLERYDKCLIVDGHSFPTSPLPYELDQSPNRPDICLGSDPFHTPEELLAVMGASARDLGLSTARNRPFAGAYVPSRFLNSDRRVASVMIEVRRGLYCDESTGRKSAAFEHTGQVLMGLLRTLAKLWTGMH